MIVDYEALAKQYNEDLSAVLRSFGSDQEFLQLWVYDEDPTQSLANLIESARAEGVEGLLIDISEATAQGTNVEEIRQMLGEEVHVTPTPRPGGVRLRVSFGSPGSAHELEDPDIDSCYHDELRASLAAPGAGVPAPGSGSGRTITSTFEGRSLEVELDEEGRRIVAAAHTGARTAVEEAALNRLCAVLLGGTPVEAANHGVIRLEWSLRGGKESPRPGIVVPEEVSPVFGLARGLCRGLLADGVEDSWNTSCFSMSEDWGTLTDGEREARIRDFLQARGEDLSGAIFERIEGGLRVYLSFDAECDGEELGPLLLRWESELCRHLEPGLELFTLERSDANVKRKH